MSTFDSNGVRIAYDDLGTGPPIVLIHGFASNRKRNWKEVGWFDVLVDAGRRVVALDCRGHGESDKPHDPSAYDIGLTAGDALRLTDHLGIDRADVMGYSMGSRITAATLVRHPERVQSAVLGGVSLRGIAGDRPDAETIALALEATDPVQITSATGREFRRFAEQGRNDLRALAACMRGQHNVATTEQLRMVSIPTLIVVGDRDNLIGDPHALAEVLPAAELVVIPGRDHLSTVGDRRYKEAVLRFLTQRTPVP